MSDHHESGNGTPDPDEIEAMRKRMSGFFCTHWPNVKAAEWPADRRIIDAAEAPMGQIYVIAHLRWLIDVHVPKLIDPNKQRYRDAMDVFCQIRGALFALGDVSRIEAEAIGIEVSMSDSRQVPADSAADWPSNRAVG